MSKRQNTGYGHQHDHGSSASYEPPAGPTAEPSLEASLTDLPQHLQMDLIVGTGAPFGVSRFQFQLKTDPHLASIWFTAHGTRPLAGAVGREWWDVGRQILADSPNVHVRDFGPLLIVAAAAGQQEVVSMLLSRPLAQLDLDDCSHSSRRLHVSVQRITARLPGHLHLLGRHRDSKAWAAGIAAVAAAHQGSTATVELLLPVLLQDSVIRRTLSWRTYLSGAAGAAGNTQVLQLLSEHDLLEHDSALMAATRAGSLEGCTWCLEHCSHASEDVVQCRLRAAAAALVMGHTKCCVLLLNGWELQQPWQPQGVGEERMQQFVRNVRARIGISESRPEDLVMALQEEVLNVANAIHANRIMQVAAQLRAFLFDGIQYRR